MPDMSEKRWRVQVHDGGRCTHESTFGDEASAVQYFEALDLPGRCRLQLREAGERRYHDRIVKCAGAIPAREPAYGPAAEETDQ